MSFTDPLTVRLRTRAAIRRKIPRGEPDRISDILEEAAMRIEVLEKLVAAHPYTDPQGRRFFG